MKQNTNTIHKTQNKNTKITFQTFNRSLKKSKTKNTKLRYIKKTHFKKIMSRLNLDNDEAN